MKFLKNKEIVKIITECLLSFGVAVAGITHLIMEIARIDEADIGNALFGKSMFSLCIVSIVFFWLFFVSSKYKSIKALKDEK